MNQEVFEFLKNKNPKLCVLATSSKNAKPESAVMGYAVKDDLAVILSTHKGSRKCHNIEENNKVAIIFGWAFTEPNVQYEGTARVLEDGDECRACEEYFFTVNPDAAQFKGPETIFIEVKPTWLRLTNLSSTPPRVQETTL